MKVHYDRARADQLISHLSRIYKGESNGGAPVLYGCQQPALVADWRSKWHTASRGQTAALFPFGIVQLAPVTEPTGFGATAIRWFQTGSPPKKTAHQADVSARGWIPNDLMPNTFMATTIDLGDALSPFGSVHCRYKQEVGERLALAALKRAYHQDVYAGPHFASATAVAGGGVELSFNETGSRGLELRPMVLNNVSGSQINWNGKTPFEICIPPSSDARPITCLGAGALPVSCCMLPAASVHYDDNQRQAFLKVPLRL